jgi:type IV secretory pathway VirB2 component (pilin)
MKKLIFTILASLLIFSLPANLVFAADTAAPATQTLDDTRFNLQILSLDDDEQENNFFQNKSYPPIVNLVLSVIDFFVKVMGSIAVIMMIVAGFLLIFSQGDQQRIDSGKEIVKYAIIGLVITFLSYTIVVTIQSIFSAQ